MIGSTVREQYLSLLHWVYGSVYTEAVWEDSYVETLDMALNGLPERLAGILRKRMAGLSLEKVAELTPRVSEGQYGPGHVTRERVRQMEAKALRMLRHPTRLRLDQYIQEKYLCELEPSGEFKTEEFEHNGEMRDYRYERKKCKRCGVFSADESETDQRCRAKREQE